MLSYILRAGPRSESTSSYTNRQNSGEEALRCGEFTSQIPSSDDVNSRSSSLVQPEAGGTALPTANVVRPPGPVAIEGVESLRAPVPQWIPNLPVHPVPTDLLEESSFAPRS